MQLESLFGPRLAFQDGMKKRKIKNRSAVPCAYVIEFCDLSSDLDRGLSLVAGLLEAMQDANDDISSETGHFVHEYLGKRAVLEHVFFGRSLISARLEASKLKAELWRIHKIRAAMKLRR